MPVLHHTPESLQERARRVDHVRQLLQSGNAGLSHRGKVVDRREVPVVVSMGLLPKGQYKERGKKKN